jgi:hypothetical protein
MRGSISNSARSWGYEPGIHQENAESASTKLEVLGTMGGGGYHTSASKRSPVLTVSSKCVEAHGIMAEYSSSHSLVPISTILFNGTLIQRTLGVP